VKFLVRATVTLFVVGSLAAFAWVAVARMTRASRVEECASHLATLWRAAHNYAVSQGG
jgi:hypothetical protein